MRLEQWSSFQGFFYTTTVACALITAIAPVLAQNQNRTHPLELLVPKIASSQSSLVIRGGGGPHSVTHGDWNGDGNLDLATANVSSNSVSVLMGNGRGQFSPAPKHSFSVGNAPVALISGDWNHDRIPDLVTANKKGNNITVLLGDGKGGFSGKSHNRIAVGKLPVALTTGDWNWDGNADLAVVNGNSHSLTLLLGNSSGGFKAFQKPIAVGNDPRSVSNGDWDRDGDLDLVVANEGSNSITVILGNGTGSFTPATYGPIRVGTQPRSVTSGDWNKDGNLDLAVANTGDDNVSVLMGNGYGAFEIAANIPTAGDGPGFLINGDWDGNGAPDLAVANRDGDSIAFLLGNGQHSFQLQDTGPILVGNRPISLTSGDWDHDGDRDLAIANLVSNNVTVLFNLSQAPSIR